MKKDLCIGSRGSKLALWQANYIKKLLLECHPNLTITIKIIKTKGDKILDSPLSQIGGKGLFVKELEDAIIRNDVDVAVHSVKDIPAELPEGLAIIAYPEREDPRDALVSKNHFLLSELPNKAILGTSSLRRKCQVLALRPDVIITELRGNLDTRLRKLKDSDMDAIIVAAAGIKRLDFENQVSQYLEQKQFLPAVGQGIIGIEANKEDKNTCNLFVPLDNYKSRIAVTAERNFLMKLQGGCQVPIAAHANVEKNKVVLDGLISSLDGKEVFRDSTEDDHENAADLGIKLAEKLLKNGGKRILDEIYNSS